METRILEPDTAAERRTEKRYDTGDCIADIMMSDPDIVCSGVVMDVSRSGLRLRANCGLPAQRLVTIRVGEITVAGRIRYCAPNSDGTFDTGVLISDLDHDDPSPALESLQLAGTT